MLDGLSAALVALCICLAILALVVAAVRLFRYGRMRIRGGTAQRVPCVDCECKPRRKKRGAQRERARRKRSVGTPVRKPTPVRDPVRRPSTEPFIPATASPAPAAQPDVAGPPEPQTVTSGSPARRPPLRTQSHPAPPPPPPAPAASPAESGGQREREDKSKWSMLPWLPSFGGRNTSPKADDAEVARGGATKQEFPLTWEALKARQEAERDERRRAEVRSRRRQRFERDRAAQQKQVKNRAADELQNELRLARQAREEAAEAAEAARQAGRQRTATPNRDATQARAEAAQAAHLQAMRKHRAREEEWRKERANWTEKERRKRIKLAKTTPKPAGRRIQDIMDSKGYGRPYNEEHLEELLQQHHNYYGLPYPYGTEQTAKEARDGDTGVQSAVDCDVGLSVDAQGDGPEPAAAGAAPAADNAAPTDDGIADDTVVDMAAEMAAVDVAADMAAEMAAAEADAEADGDADSEDSNLDGMDEFVGDASEAINLDGVDESDGDGKDDESEQSDDSEEQ